MTRARPGLASIGARWVASPVALRLASRPALSPALRVALCLALLAALCLALLAVATGCGASGTSAREGSAPGVLAPAAFSLTLRGMEITLDDDGAVRAGDCAASLDFAAAALTAADGHVLSHLSGDGWPRALVIGTGDPPVTVSEREVVAGDRTLFSIADDGRLLDAGFCFEQPAWPAAARDLVDAWRRTPA